MMMNSGSFESLKSYLFALNLKKEYSSTFNVCNLGSNYLYLLHIMGFVDSLTHTTVIAYKRKKENLLILGNSYCGGRKQDGCGT